jgi:AcrR family transcriptional regulator
MTAPSPVRERKKRDTWRLIHSTALRLMQQHGFDAVSVDDIVAAAGISRRTFFNYFPGKEAVVFDPDPDDPALWRDLLAARPADEPVWTALREVLLGYTDAIAARMTVQRRIRLASPELETCSREVADQFWESVRSWVATRTGGDRLRSLLAVNAAQTVLTTACPLWDVDRGVEHLHDLIRESFDVLGAGLLAEPRLSPYP